MKHALLVVLLLAAASAPAADQGSTASQAMRRYFPNVPLRTHEGKNVRFYDDMVQGKIVVMQLMFRGCDKYCSVVTPKLVKIQRELEKQLGDQVRFLSISIDPDRDTPAALAEYAAHFGVQKNWYFLTGKRDDVDLIRRKLGVYDPEEQKLEHLNVLTIGNEPAGQWVDMPAPSSNEEIVRTVLRLARPAGGTAAARK